MKCKICGKKPEQISEYITESKLANLTPSEFVRLEEGTYNPTTDLFYCTNCYIKIGMPRGVAGKEGQ